MGKDITKEDPIDCQSDRSNHHEKLIEFISKSTQLPKTLN